MFTQVRLTAYIVAALGALGSLLALMGWATFDHTTGMVDFAPFNVYLLAPILAAPLASFLAWLAVIFRWGPSKDDKP